MHLNPSETTISVVGLGYVGLPTALALHKAGFEVFGIDISENVIQTLNAGKLPFVDEGTELIIPTGSERWGCNQQF